MGLCKKMELRISEKAKQSPENREIAQGRFEGAGNIFHTGQLRFDFPETPPFNSSGLQFQFLDFLGGAVDRIANLLFRVGAGDKEAKTSRLFLDGRVQDRLNIDSTMKQITR